MFVRVFDKAQNRYYKSMVYASVNSGWFAQYIVHDPHAQCFALVDYLDKAQNPPKALVEVIQPDREGFAFYEGSQTLKFKRFCKVNGYSYPDVQCMAGYPEVLENHAFLAAILTNRSVPLDAFDIPLRTLADTEAWNYILTQADADEFMKLFVGFHDSELKEIHYTGLDPVATVNAVFDNSGWYGVAELCFEGVQLLKIVPPEENYLNFIYEASLFVEDERVFWADSYLKKPDYTYEGSIIQALNLKWRKL